MEYLFPVKYREEKRFTQRTSTGFFLAFRTGKVSMEFPGGSDGKASAYNGRAERDVGLIPGSQRSPGGGHGNPLQYSCLVNPHGQRSLVGYSPWGHKEWDMTEQLSIAQHSCPGSKLQNNVKWKW